MSTTSAHQPSTSLAGEPVAVLTNGDHAGAQAEGAGDTAAATRSVAAATGVVYAYRDVGSSDVPVVLPQHFRGNLDNGNPALVDDLAAQRRVIAFDTVGVGATTGTTACTVEEMAHGAIDFLDAIGCDRVDVLGFSLGSFVAQEIALIRPSLVSRLVPASSAPRGAWGMHGWAADVIDAVGGPSPAPRV